MTVTFYLLTLNCPDRHLKPHRVSLDIIGTVHETTYLHKQVYIFFEISVTAVAYVKVELSGLYSYN